MKRFTERDAGAELLGPDARLERGGDARVDPIDDGLGGVGRLDGRAVSGGGSTEPTAKPPPWLGTLTTT